MTDEIRIATEADRTALVHTVVEAFRNDPAFTWFFQEAYDEQAPLFTEALFDCRIATNGIWVTDSVQAVALWDLPGAAMSSDLSGLSPEAIARLDEYHDVVHHLMPEQPFWYLGVLASHPDRRGSGLATVVCREGLQAATRDGVPAVLETTAPDNVAMYERRGWSVHASAEMDALTVWVMTHPGA
ncbi:MAG: GNAT family N-acetyltransferase [Actinomycetota bacterium]